MRKGSGIVYDDALGGSIMYMFIKIDVAILPSPTKMMYSSADAY